MLALARRRSLKLILMLQTVAQYVPQVANLYPQSRKYVKRPRTIPTATRSTPKYLFYQTSSSCAAFHIMFWETCRYVDHEETATAIDEN